MKTIFTILLQLLFLLQVNGQSLTFDEKIEKMLELSGAKENFDSAIKNMIAYQKNVYLDVFDQSFFEEFEKEILKEGSDLLIPQLIPVYKKHLTEKEVEKIIKFYESSAGKSLTKKTPLIMKDALEIGTKWGEEVGLRIAEKLNNTNEIRFQVELTEDCQKFREGTFEDLTNPTKTSKIIRKEFYQTEYYGNYTFKYKIDWVDNNTYILSDLDSEGKVIADSELTINIYEVDGNLCKYIARMAGSNIYKEGKLMKLE